ncbi:MAG: hypothetical protein RLZZ422_2153 [Pseudomonadota bacterium]
MIIEKLPIKIALTSSNLEGNRMTQGYKTGGRVKGSINKATASIREAAQQYTETALKTLVEVMSDETAPHAARVAAANSLLDRGHGKPRQELDVDHKGELTHLIVKFVDSDGDGNAVE